MAMQNLPTPEYLRQRLRYDPETGKLFWRSYEGMPNWWNTVFADTAAFDVVDSNGYLVGSVNDRKMGAHRVIWAMHYGFWPPEEIDHIDHDKSHNRIENLRLADRLQNSRNRSIFRNNTSGVCGVTWCKQTSKWRASIKISGSTKCLGRFADFDAAVAVRKSAEKANGFHKNHGASK